MRPIHQTRIGRRLIANTFTPAIYGDFAKMETLFIFLPRVVK